MLRVLESADLDVLARFCGHDRLPRATMARELACRDNYLWMGLFCDGGQHLAAVHRSMRLGDHLLLKGLTVALEWQGSAAALRLSQAIRAQSRTEGWEGVAVWIEPFKPERLLAARLGIAAGPQLLHRYLVPIEGTAPGTVGGAGAFAGSFESPFKGEPLVPRLVPGPARQVPWVLDDQRLVLGANPCASVSELPLLLDALRPVAATLGALSLEIHLPAADLPSALALIGRGVRRLSRTPVQLGLATFPAAVACRPQVPMAAASGIAGS